MTDDVIHVTLGEHEVPVYPQRHAGLTNKLAKLVGKLQANDTEIGDSVLDVINFLDDKVYDLLVIAIPMYGKRCPKYEYMGFASQEAWDKQEFDDDADRSPDIPQILEAFKVAAYVNHFDVWNVVQKVIDPKELRAEITAWMKEALRSNRLRNLPSPNDGSPASTSGSQKSQISTESTE